MVKAKYIDIDLIKEWLIYDEATGTFTWRKAHYASIPAGRPAGTIVTGGIWGIKLKYRLYPVHRLVWLMEHQDQPMPGMIDFKDGNRLNTRISNLRPLSKKQHMANISANRLKNRG